MHHQHRAQAQQTAGEDGPTLLFQRNLPGQGERCTICPFNKPVGTNSTAGTSPPRPVLPQRPPATLPRPALLTELRGSGTLVMPDALRSTGPDAATIEQAPGPPFTGRAARDPDFDELASPDITVLQPALAPAIHPVRPARPRRRARAVSTRAYVALNICLGLLIVAGLVLLALREVPSAAPAVSASE